MGTQFSLDWALFLCAREGDLEKAKSLLAQGADPNFAEPMNGTRHPWQYTTTLKRAVSYGSIPFVELLFEAGATIPKEEEKQLSLAEAATLYGKDATLLRLLELGLPPRRVHHRWALSKGHSELAAYLLERLGEFEVHYDIDALMADRYVFFVKFIGAVPEHYSPFDGKLSVEERSIRDLCEFGTDIVNGLGEPFAQQHFDTIYLAY